MSTYIHINICKTGGLEFKSRSYIKFSIYPSFVENFSIRIYTFMYICA